METEATEAGTKNERWPLVRDVLAFQCKLVVDGFRDLVLVPVSLITGLVSVIGKDGTPGREFYDLLRAAQRTERWINLFGAVEEREPRETGAADTTPAGTPDLDTLIARVETFLVDEYRKGGVTAQAKERLDAALESLHGMRNRIGGGGRADSP
ncbi:MAG TPA: hypothetical protein VF200_09880 [Woeseiaceae bacterium]